MVGGESAEIVAWSRFKAHTVTTYMSELFEKLKFPNSRIYSNFNLLAK